MFDFSDGGDFAFLLDLESEVLSVFMFQVEFLGGLHGKNVIFYFKYK